MSHWTFLKQATVLLLILALALPGSALAAARRQGVSEFYITSNWFGAESFKFNNGAQIDIDNDIGWRLGYAYNFDKHLELGADFGWASTKYRVSTVDENNIPISYNGDMDIWDGHINGTYNILKGGLTPFVTGGLGFTTIDTGIPTGLPTNVCWVDPWGYIYCNSYQSTKVETAFSYKAGIGLRWDVNNQVYLKGACSQTWMDISNTSSTPAIRSGSIDLGFMF